jgi:hypothetical protein
LSLNGEASEWRNGGVGLRNMEKGGQDGVFMYWVNMNGESQGGYLTEGRCQNVNGNGMRLGWSRELRVGGWFNRDEERVGRGLRLRLANIARKEEENEEEKRRRESWESTYSWSLIPLRVEHVGHRRYTFHAI